jgi:hypothetical protein
MNPLHNRTDRSSRRNDKKRKPLSGFMRFLVAVLVFQTGVSTPLLRTAGIPETRMAYAGGSDEDVCGKINDSQKANKDPNVPVPGYTDCVIADQARTAKQQATVKSVVFGVLAAACVALAYIGGDIAASCTWISMGASMLGMAYDMSLKQKIEDSSKATSSAIRGGISALIGLAEGSKLAGKAKDLFGAMGKGSTTKTPSGGKDAPKTAETAPNNPDAAPKTDAPAAQSDPNAPAQTNNGTASNSGNGNSSTGGESGGTNGTDANAKADTKTTDTKGTDSKSTDTKSKAETNEHKGACLMSAVTLGIMTGLAIWEAADAKSIQNMKIEAAKNAVYVAGTTKRIENPSFGGSTGGAANSQTGASVQEAPSSAKGDPCQAATGNSYLTCTFQGTNAAPAISALIGDNRVNSIVGRMTGGKTLGDLAKGFRGEATPSAIGNYAGSAVGFPSNMASAFGKHLETVTAMIGKERGADPGGIYSSKGSSLPNSKPGGAGDLDFSKMMEGLLKQMNPEEAQTGATKEAASEAVFRRLDLLPAEKIENNRDISLFVRVGYRYRKKTPSIVEPGAP